MQTRRQASRRKGPGPKKTKTQDGRTERWGAPDTQTRKRTVQNDEGGTVSDVFTSTNMANSLIASSNTSC
eukprot:11554695-Alexandrium_andersonii.AAC.1